MASYFTRQQKAVLDCVAAHSGQALTAADVCEALRRSGERVGLATVYRQLDRLSREGWLHRVVTEEGACYQRCTHGDAGGCFLLKCEQCGRIEHVDCTHLTPLYAHLAQEHGFAVDPRRTMLYGLCRSCREAQT